MVETFYELPVPATIALAADLHNAEPAPALASLRARRPALICVAGDLIRGGARNATPIDEAQPNVLPFLRNCAAIAPTFVSLGNHEWPLTPEDIDAMGRTSARVLDNAWAELEIRGEQIAVGGLTSGYAVRSRRLGAEEPGNRRHNRPDTAWLTAFERLPGFRLLLCHHPEYYPEYLASRDVDLVLAGHAHGGQWRFFNRGVYAPGQGLWPRLTGGVHGRLVVSRGLSNTTRIPRINNPTELVYIRRP